MATTAGETFKAVSKDMMETAKTSFSELGIDMVHTGSDLLKQTINNVEETAGETVDKILSGLTN